VPQTWSGKKTKVEGLDIEIKIKMAILAISTQLTFQARDQEFSWENIVSTSSEQFLAKRFNFLLQRVEPSATFKEREDIAFLIRRGKQRNTVDNERPARQIL
jgi:hypothetical protein